MQKNLKIKIILSLIFAALNTAAILILFEVQAYGGFGLHHDWRNELANVIISAILTVIYIISSRIIENKWEIGNFKILFIQFGSYITVIAFLLAKCFILTKLGFFIFGINFLKTVIPALILSFIIRLTAKLIKKS